MSRCLLRPCRFRNALTWVADLVWNAIVKVRLWGPGGRRRTTCVGVYALAEIVPKVFRTLTMQLQPPQRICAFIRKTLNPINPTLIILKPSTLQNKDLVVPFRPSHVSSHLQRPQQAAPRASRTRAMSAAAPSLSLTLSRASAALRATRGSPRVVRAAPTAAAACPFGFSAAPTPAASNNNSSSSSRRGLIPNLPTTRESPCTCDATTPALFTEGRAKTWCLLIYADASLCCLLSQRSSKVRIVRTNRRPTSSLTRLRARYAPAARAPALSVPPAASLPVAAARCPAPRRLRRPTSRAPARPARSAWRGEFHTGAARPLLRRPLFSST